MPSDSATDAEPSDHTRRDDTPTENPRDTSGRAATRPPHRTALAFGLLAVTGLAGLCGWQGYGLHRQHLDDQRSATYLQTGRQGALNLTTVDWQHAENDVQRILDMAAGSFYDDFSSRAADFIDVVKQTRSHTEGSIVEAGIESETPTGAQILVAVNVKTSQPNQPEQPSRGWRMRVTVEAVHGGAKISNVEFVA